MTGGEERLVSETVSKMRELFFALPVELWDEASRRLNICRGCGTDTTASYCHCENDE